MCKLFVCFSIALERTKVFKKAAGSDQRSDIFLNRRAAIDDLNDIRYDLISRAGLWLDRPQGTRPLSFTTQRGYVARAALNDGEQPISP
jgi:hypothetical protein